MSSLPTQPDAPTRLTALPDADLRAALAGADEESALRLLAGAASFAEQSRLLRHLPVRVRLRALDRLPAPVFAGLVQNREEENRYLVGELSASRFRELLSLCHPAWQLYWLALAAAEPTSRAAAFPLAVPAPELARALLTEPAFVAHVRAAATYPVQDLRLPPDALRDPLQTLFTVLGPEGMLKTFPLPEGPARQVTALLLDQAPEQYLDVLRAALKVLDYQATHPEEEELLSEEPLLLPVEAIAPAPPPAAASPPEPVRLPVPVLLPLATVTGALPPERREALAAELHDRLLREAIAAGGSFLASDLEETARRLAATLKLGAAGLGFGDAPAALTARSAGQLLAAGDLELERLRQLAIRLRPFREVLDTAQRGVVEALAAPRLDLDAERQPVLEIFGPGGARPVPVPEARARLQEVAAWVELARGLTFRRTAAALREAKETPALAAGLALGAALYGRIEFGLAEADDLATFARRYLSPRTRSLLPRARVALRRAAERWAAERKLPPEAGVAALEAGLERLAGALREAGEPADALPAVYLDAPPEAPSPAPEEEEPAGATNEP